MLKKSIPGVLLLGLICFFFTFASVSCNGQPLVAITGIQMVTGSSVSAPQMFGPPKVQKIPPESSVIIAFLCGIVALGLSFLPGKKTIFIPVGLSTIALIALFIFKSNLDSEAMRQTGGMIHPEFGNGFWGAVLFYLGALVLGVVEARSSAAPALNRSTPVRKCSNCGEEVQQEWKFCKHCAKPLEQEGSPAVRRADTGDCSRCGTNNSQGTRYCKRCGQALAGSSRVGETQGLRAASSADEMFSGHVDADGVSSHQQTAVSYTNPKADVGMAVENSETIGNQVALDSRPSVDSRPASVTLTEKHSPMLVWGIALGVALISMAVGWYLWGVELQLVTDPGKTTVVLDGRTFGKTSEQGGALVLPHLLHGVHTLSLSHEGFDKWSEPIPLGWFEFSKQLNVKLPVQTFPLTILTIPATAKVQMDGQDVGATDGYGKLLIAKVPRGQHAVTVTMDGYPSWSNSVWVRSPASVRVDLATAAAAQHLAIASGQNASSAAEGQKEHVQGSPEIEFLSELSPEANQTINITGHGFGNQNPYNGNSRYILITDLTRSWNAGNTNGNDLVTLKIVRWTDTQITIHGFTGAYGRGWSLGPGDKVRIQIWNPQTGAGPAISNIAVAAKPGQ
jgi:Double zinc ribbon/PEGA domain